MNTYRQQNHHAVPARRAGVLRALDTRAINLLLIVAAVAMFVSYLALNNRASTKGFQIRALESKIGALETEKQKLDIAVVAAHSMDTIEGGIKGLGFVPVSRMDFVTIPGGAVAVR